MSKVVNFNQGILEVLTPEQDSRALHKQPYNSIIAGISYNARKQSQTVNYSHTLIFSMRVSNCSLIHNAIHYNHSPNKLIREM